MDRGYNKQISLKVQRLIHGLKKPESYCLNNLLLKLLLDKKNTYKNTTKLVISLANVLVNFTCNIDNVLVTYLYIYNSPFLGTICKVVLSNRPHERKASHWLRTKSFVDARKELVDAKLASIFLFKKEIDALVLHLILFCEVI